MAGSAGAAVSERRVKVHVFEPSGRELWTVVGRSREYWVDPEMSYCSCPGFYYASARGRGGCYHLESARQASADGSAERTSFEDSEYAAFVSGIVSGL